MIRHSTTNCSHIQNGIYSLILNRINNLNRERAHTHTHMFLLLDASMGRKKTRFFECLGTWCGKLFTLVRLQPTKTHAVIIVQNTRTQKHTNTQSEHSYTYCDLWWSMAKYSDKLTNWNSKTIKTNARIFYGFFFCSLLFYFLRVIY